MAAIRNSRHEMFCQTYMNCKKRRVRYNATRSYMEIYPRASYKTAMVNGPRLTKKYQFYIDEMFEAQMKAEFPNEKEDMDD